MRTSGSAPVLAAFCFAVSIAPLFAHASATHFDKRGLNPFRKTESIESLSHQKSVRAGQIGADILSAVPHAASGSRVPPDIVAKVKGHEKMLNKLEKMAQKAHKKDPSEASERMLGDLNELKKTTGSFISHFS
ncbi:hypothetical protein F5148DRAFT_1243799 [Russula earlei]|uniref:Uncharacterized protein n=1 Tax=Russula earlei TaxID=71964 RepID=A0ACC0TV32_9AGAM|nr:hypothetical protein F5148DRAFT_1243799 [Russula earlei]